ncbi:hypothetical protein [Clostridium magnum]|uniref:Uncharacterized protein n=1 Tax=Clostridium magnum DSM 2767 TaxID=1121326 RepID=A0A161X7B1_9CLOT|nr:hypothetical protein [Clostridium magnum]KZL89996.1 hypothetical protein CLMAG_44800 [Clostridium magnum DSM 2767]SHI86773.1 hypothetical protein SAMN02745944_04973 [Clostridium magnum DSM 2767]
MKETNLKLAQKDIDEALSVIESMEESLTTQSLSKDTLKEKFVFLAEKVQQLESILKEEGILE